MLDEVRSWSTLGMTRDRGSWLMVPQLVNAYYSPPDGEIVSRARDGDALPAHNALQVFPAGFLQRPWFSAGWPAHLNFGAFGTVAAHELTHAFDNTGAQYDERGLLRDWWTKVGSCTQMSESPTTDGAASPSLLSRRSTRRPNALPRSIPSTLSLVPTASSTTSTAT